MASEEPVDGTETSSPVERMKATKSKSLSIALNYIKRGWSPIPLPDRSKKPAEDDTGWPSLRIDAKTAPQHFNGGLQNIGVLTGAASGGLADTDLDNLLAVQLAPSFLPKTAAIFGRAGKPNSHYLYTITDGAGPRVTFKESTGNKDTDEMLVEYRGDGCQTVFPGSRHEGTGEAITWSQDGAPARVTRERLLRSIGGLAAATLITKRWNKGNRDDLCAAVVGSMLRAGAAVPSVEVFITAICQATGDEQLRRDRLSKVRRAAAILAKGGNDTRKVWGWPKLEELIGGEALKLFRSWLGLTQHKDRLAQINVQPGGLPEAVDATITALAAHAAGLSLYVNGGRLVRPSVVEHDGFAGSDGKPQTVQCLELCPVSLTNFRVDLTRIIAFTVARNVGHGHVNVSVVDCPKDVACAVFEASERLAALPQIERIAEVPVFDGTQLCAEPGLHGRTWVNAPAGIALPTTLSREVASAALQRLVAVLDEFPFETPVDRAVALALLMTAALRPSLPTAPGFLLSKPSYGAGATFLAKLAGLIATGREPAVSPFSEEHEGRKQLNAALIAGRSVLILDNLAEGLAVSNPLLAQLTSETLLEVRELGTGRLHLIDCRRLVVGTGVGIYAGDDLTRRFLTCNLDPMLESPEARTFKRPELLAEVQRERPVMLRDLYTITAAYLAQPACARVQALAGYTTWVRWVAEPLVWLGEPDVIETSRQAAATDNKTSLLQRLFPLLERLQSGRPNGVTVHDMMMREGNRHGGDEWRKLKEALHEVLGEATRARVFDEQPQLNPVHVARWLASVAQRVVGGKRLVESGRLRGQPRWTVETVRRAPSADPGEGT